ncbi:MAG: hypothetical protein DRH37_02510 [Deltaproteobacteria bacterium]|nr:MAG: hypothetical protein DRH37_02510 [Deltaproteobacteria bacterium]
MPFQLNSSIPLMAQVPNVGNAIQRGLENATMIDQLRISKEQAPIRKQMLEQQAQLQNQAVQQQAIALQDETRDQRLADTAMWMFDMPRMFEAGDFKGVMQTATQAKADALQIDPNADVSDQDDIMAAIMSGDAADISRMQSGVANVLEIAQKTGVFGRQLSASQRDFRAKTKGLSDPDKEKARRISLGLDARAVGSAAQTIAEEDKTEIVAESEAEIAGKKAEAVTTSEARGLSKSAPLIATAKAEIATAVALASAAAKERGEVFTDLSRAEASLPGLMTTVDQLKELAPLVTSTIGGRVVDALVKEAGFGATKGSTAKAKFTALIQNQVLPLLKPTFGAAFTAQEGAKLEATLGDVNAEPAEKLAALDVFIGNKMRELQTSQRKLGEDVTPVEEIRARAISKAVQAGGLSPTALDILGGIP